MSKRRSTPPSSASPLWRTLCTYRSIGTRLPAWSHFHDARTQDILSWIPTQSSITPTTNTLKFINIDFSIRKRVARFILIALVYYVSLVDRQSKKREHDLYGAIAGLAFVASTQLETDDTPAFYRAALHPNTGGAPTPNEA
jgi:hypothetical protein